MALVAYTLCWSWFFSKLVRFKNCYFALLILVKIGHCLKVVEGYYSFLPDTIGSRYPAVWPLNETCTSYPVCFQLAG